MPAERTAAQEPVLQLALALPAPLAEILRARPAAAEAARAALDALLARLGVPGGARLEVVDLPPSDPPWRCLRLRVEGRECRYPPALLSEIRWLVEGVPPREDASPAAVLAWLQEQANETGAAGDALAGFLRHACPAVLALQPELLLGEVQTRAYRDRLAAHAEAEGEAPPREVAGGERAVAALRSALAQRLSLADLRTVLTVLGAAARQPEAPAEEVAEQLIAALRPPRVEIRVAAGELRSLTGAGPGSNSFAHLRDRLFVELGIRVPDFRFVPDPELPPRSFCFMINHLPTPPVIAQRPGESAGGSPLDHVLLQLDGTLRAQAGAFVDRTTVETELGRLEPALPQLVAAVRARYPLSLLAGALRSLAAEDISIRNGRALLERLLDFDTIAVEEQEYIVLDDRLPRSPAAEEHEVATAEGVAAFLRTGMARYISNKYRGPEPSLQVYLLNPAIEQALSRRPAAEPQPPDRAAGNGAADAAASGEDAILAAVWRAIGQDVPRQTATAILTLTGVRPLLRRLIAAEIPWLPVLAYQELAPDLTVQSAGPRISL